MKTNHDGTITLNAYDTWTSCLDCGQKVTGDSIHTCSPQLKTLTDEEIKQCVVEAGFQFNGDELVLYDDGDKLLLRPNYMGTVSDGLKEFARAILRKAQEK